MNTGAFGENFPYSNFHDLNMDWIIKIAKDFLDQYTHIQEVIATGEQELTELTTQGLEQLQDKADNLENLLQEWYDTHSEDIADQLADALQSIANQLEIATNDISAERQSALNDIDTKKTDSIDDIDDYVSTVVASIPADYSALSAMVQALTNKIPFNDYQVISNSYVNYENGNFSSLGGATRTEYVNIKGFKEVTVVVDGFGDSRGLAFYDAQRNYIANSGTQYPAGLNTINVSVPANAELVAFSLPVVSITFTPDLSNLDYFKDEIVKNSVINELTPTLIDDNYINSQNGNFSILTDTAQRTNLIDREYFDVIYLLVYGWNDIRGIAFYDSNRQFITGVAYAFHGMRLLQVNIPEKAKYFAYTNTKIVEGEKCYIAKTDNALKKSAVLYNNTIIRPTLGFTNDNYINCTNGNRSILSDCQASYFFNLDNVEKVIVAETGYGDNRGYALYNKEGVFVRGQSYLSGYHEYEVIPSDGIRFIAVTKETNAFDFYVIPKNKQTNTDNAVSMFKNIAGCGDSYTSCVLYTIDGISKGENEYASWISNIGRKLGIQSNIYAHGGATTESYLVTADCLPKLLSEPAKDLYILNLGINDHGYGITLGTISDIHSDYHDNPNTFYGNYGRIIDQIKAHAPNAKLIIAKILYTNSTTQEVTNAYRYSSDAIEEIASHYGIPFIDTLESEYLNSYEYATGKYGGHPTAPQQAKIADAMIELINKCITENYSYFGNYTP